MRKLILTILLVLGSLFSKAQYDSDSCAYYPDMFLEEYEIRHNRYALDIENRGDSTILIIRNTRNSRDVKELYLAGLIGLKADTDGCHFATFVAKDLRLDEPRFVTLVRNAGKYIEAAVYDGKTLTIWFLRIRDKDLRP